MITSEVGATRRLFALGLAACALTGTLAPTPAAAVQSKAPRGELEICVSGTQGHAATVEIARKGEVIRTFELAGCRTRHLPYGKFRITQTSPEGYRTVGAGGGSGVVVAEDGVGMTSSVYKERIRKPKRAHTLTGYVDNDGATSSLYFENKRVRS